MTISMGLNVKLTAAHHHRPAWRALFGALGLRTVLSPPTAEIAELDDGGHFGVFFVEEADAIPEELAVRAPWLELRVGDLAGATAALDALATPRVAYHDEAHHYFRSPGGIVFRLAQLS